MTVYRYIKYMNFEQLLLSVPISVNQLSKISNVPRTTILDIVRGRSEMKKASGETLYKIAKTLNVSIESLIELDSPFDFDSITGKPKDCSYFECSLSDDMTHILRNLKKSICEKNVLKQSYWKDQLLEEITSLRRKDDIGDDSYSYFYEQYLRGSIKND